jgi:hypothetical protein
VVIGRILDRGEATGRLNRGPGWSRPDNSSMKRAVVGARLQSEAKLTTIVKAAPAPRPSASGLRHGPELRGTGRH